MHPATLPIAELLDQVVISRRRGGGPGGQRRNKVETGARLRHRPTGISAEATERRSFEENRKVAVGRLRLALALRHREPAPAGSRPGGLPEGAGRPSELWRRRTAGPSLAVAAEHDDVPALLAEALDVLAACDDDMQMASTRLAVSPSRLVKVLALQPAALSALNARRAAAGRRPLR